MISWVNTVITIINAKTATKTVVSETKTSTKTVTTGAVDRFEYETTRG